LQLWAFSRVEQPVAAREQNFTIHGRSRGYYLKVITRCTGLTAAAVNKSLVHLDRLGVVAELTQRQRGRVFSYTHCADILREGMGLPH
jgi:Fic family protein